MQLLHVIVCFPRIEYTSYVFDYIYIIFKCMVNNSESINIQEICYNILIHMDIGTEYVTDYIQNYKGCNVCYNCGKKLGLFGWKQINGRFGLQYKLCKDCFKQVKHQD